MENGNGDGVRTLVWELKTDGSGEPSRLDVRADGAPMFADLPLESVYSPSWNLLRLTGRGLDSSSETLSVAVTPDGTVFIVR